MRICEHCGAGIPNYAGFCGMCGQLITISEPTKRAVWKSPHTPTKNVQTLVITVHEQDEFASDNQPTSITTAPVTDDLASDNQPTLITAVPEDDNLASDNRQTLITTAPAEDEFASDNQPTLITAVPEDDEPTADEEEEEERRRRLALIETGLPLLVDVIATQATGGIPVVQGTPQISDVPTVQGTPQVNEAPTVPQTPSVTGTPPPFGAGSAPLILPNVETGFSPPFTNTPYPTGQPGSSPHLPKKPQPQPTSGCTTVIILVFIVPFLILGSIIGMGFTILAPALSLTGNANVTVGGTLQLSGSHFIPGNTVTCVLDGGAPLSISSTTSSYPHGVNSSITGALLFANQSSSIAQTRRSSANTAIIVGGDGTFHVTFAVSQSWQLGKHTIRATETLSPRSASITFTVTNTNTSPTATSTTPTTNTTTSTATPGTATPTLQATPGLSAVTPNSITFGPISVGYTQPVSTQVIINTMGTQLLGWTASWNQAQAPWLQMNLQSGQIQAPNAQTVVVSANVGNLQAGTYNSIITFINTLQNAQTFALPISLTVQTGCITATPTTLNFTATLGGPNLTAQTVALNNCGALGNWSEAITGGSWLQVSPTGGTLNNGATQNVVVSTALANAKSGATTYQGQIMFSNGTAHVAINVTLVVHSIQIPAILSVTPATLSTRQQCSLVIRTWICPGIALSSNQTATSVLNWTAVASGITSITVIPSSGTLQPGQTATVQIDIPRFPCAANGGVSATVTFTGPTNSIPVTIGC